MLYRAAKSIAFPSQERKPTTPHGGARETISAHANSGTYLLIGYVDKILHLSKLCATGTAPVLALFRRLPFEEDAAE